MKKHEESRRAFLIGTAVGASAVAGAGLVPNALAQTHEQHNAADVPATTAQGHAHAGGHGAFLNDDDARHGRGIRRADHAGRAGQARRARRRRAQLHRSRARRRLFRSAGLLPPRARCARCAIAARPTASRSRSSRAAQQDEVITRARKGKATGFTWPTAQAFFNTVRTHTMEGMFADPVYGGNKDFAGWVLVGFPGAQPLFSPADMNSKEAFTGAPIIGLQSQSKTVRRRT